MGANNLREIAGLIRPGMTVVDVGANVGVWTAAFSRWAGPRGRVIALEPAPANLLALQQAKQRNAWANVEIHGVAAADSEGTMFLECSSFNSGNNSLSLGGGTNKAVQVQTVRLDSLLAGTRVDVLKIDVQGWEASVLRGAKETLRRNRPIMARLEVWPAGLRRVGSNLDEILEILASCGLEVVAPRGEELQAAWRDEWYFDLSARAE
jgi:FkbM family methyltransferase